MKTNEKKKKMAFCIKIQPKLLLTPIIEKVK